MGADGSRVVTGSADRTARIWDAETGRQLLTLAGHSGPVNSVAFCTDGRRAVSGSEDGTIRPWDAETRLSARPMRRLHPPQELQGLAAA